MFLPQAHDQRCDTCGGKLLVLKYDAADGDLMFEGSGLIEGSGELQTRAALVCDRCDGIAQMPRVKS